MEPSVKFVLTIIDTFPNHKNGGKFFSGKRTNQRGRGGSSLWQTFSCLCFPEKFSYVKSSWLMKGIWWLSCNQTCIADVVAKSSAVWWVGEGGSGVKKAQVGSALLLLPPNNSHKFSQNFLLSIFSFFINLIFVKKGLYFSENGLPFAGIGLYFLKMDFTVEVLSLVAIVLLRVSTGQWASFLAEPHHKWLLLVHHHHS